MKLNILLKISVLLGILSAPGVFAGFHINEVSGGKLLVVFPIGESQLNTIITQIQASTSITQVSFINGINITETEAIIAALLKSPQPLARVDFLNAHPGHMVEFAMQVLKVHPTIELHLSDMPFERKHLQRLFPYLLHARALHIGPNALRDDSIPLLALLAQSQVLLQVDTRLFTQAGEAQLSQLISPPAPPAPIASPPGCSCD